jgi:hypothetical protein
VALESCTIKDECVIGMGSTIMEGAVIGRRSMVAAGSVVPAGAYIPPGQVQNYIKSLTPASYSDVSRNGRYNCLYSSGVGTLRFSSAISVLTRYVERHICIPSSIFNFTCVCTLFEQQNGLMGHAEEVHKVAGAHSNEFQEYGTAYLDAERIAAKN